MAIHESTESDKFRVVIEQFLRERLEARLSGLAADDNLRKQLVLQFQYLNWLKKASNFAHQIHLVTHPLRATFPEAKVSETTSIYRDPSGLDARTEMGSHCLSRSSFREDTAGNAAVSTDWRADILAFLRLPCFGRTLFERLQTEDADLIAAFNPDALTAKKWAQDFKSFVHRPEPIASHTRAKQIYWLIGDDPQNDSHFQVLAPLYASSLAHAAFQRVSEDRFGEAGKLARQARREQREHDSGVHEYPNLAVQKLGGTKPQNISQLNSERGGTNYLLASLPPSWKSREVREPWMTESVFPRFGRRQDVRDLVRDLRKFLASNPGPNMQTRDRRDDFVDALIGELVMFAAELQSGLPAGWSSDAKCRLVESERLWLDPGRAATDADFGALWLHMEWPDEIGHRFGNWLNKQLVDHLSVGDAEHRHWVRELGADQEWAWRIDQDRRRIEVPVATGGTP